MPLLLLTVAQRRGKLFREVRAAVIVGRSVSVEFLLVFRRPPPGASFPPGYCRFSASSPQRRLTVGRGSDSLYGDVVLGSSGMPVIAALH